MIKLPISWTHVVFIKKKPKVKDVSAGVGEDGFLSLSGITRMLLQELMPRFDLHWTDLEYFKKN